MANLHVEAGDLAYNPGNAFSIFLKSALIAGISTALAGRSGTLSIFDPNGRGGLTR